MSDLTLYFMGAEIPRWVLKAVDETEMTGGGMKEAAPSIERTDF
ncbi:hypothetical protein ACCC98_30860 [Rhizobium pisi]